MSKEKAEDTFVRVEPATCKVTMNTLKAIWKREIAYTRSKLVVDAKYVPPSLKAWAAAGSDNLMKHFEKQDRTVFTPKAMKLLMGK